MADETKDKKNIWIDKVHPQQAAALKKNIEIVESLGGAGETLYEIRESTNKARSIWNKGGPDMDVQQDKSIAGPFRDVPMRLYKWKNKPNLPIFLYLHGGGFKLGNQLSNDRQMREIAKEWGGAVISCDYVHVPEHSFPDPVIEITAVVEWLSKEAKGWGLDGNSIVIGGASAGASVSFGVAFELCTRRPNLIKGVVSIYGVLDDNLNSDSMNELGNGDFIFDVNYVSQVYSDYVQSSDRNDPRAFAVKGDVTSLPSAFIAAAELDPIRDDSIKLAKIMEEKGHPHYLKIYPGVMHTFFTQSNMIDQAKICISDICDYLHETIGTG
ncbi:MAG: alpha/beta hydrolase fold domain-containing protein [Alphaproteobacteria bacterium]|nr:alpha/beta hydrolase fold domain-containing protein [Alphaproteobacteria bacterium]|tara:strand:- start:149 stop:1126 length:978 start_codon:yes stop_codon:yes gene_type:complete